MADRSSPSPSCAHSLPRGIALAPATRSRPSLGRSDGENILLLLRAGAQPCLNVGLINESERRSISWTLIKFH